jgi:hypothetical protein
LKTITTLLREKENHVFLLHIVLGDGGFDVLLIGIGRAIRSFVSWLVLVGWLSELMNERKRIINYLITDY